MIIGIINYGIGNIGSVIGSINNLNIKYKVIENEREFEQIDKLILPGVGNFKKCKEILDAKNFTKRIKKKVLEEKVPILGICLGMQLLASRGTEGCIDNKTFEGLNLIEGKIVSLKKLGSKLILPHIGWNNVKIKKKSNIIKNIPDKTDFYFVHSYAYSNINKDFIIGNSKYGISFPVIINNKNVWGTQFHPEKSSKAGLEIIKNFINI